MLKATPYTHARTHTCCVGLPTNCQTRTLLVDDLAKTLITWSFIIPLLFLNLVVLHEEVKSCCFFSSNASLCLFVFTNSYYLDYVIWQCFLCCSVGMTRLIYCTQFIRTYNGCTRVRYNQQMHLKEIIVWRREK